LYWDMVDQAYGEDNAAGQVKARPLSDPSEVPTEELQRQLAELKARLRRKELREKAG
jgi:hypothetical protein